MHFLRVLPVTPHQASGQFGCGAFKGCHKVPHHYAARLSLHNMVGVVCMVFSTVGGVFPQVVTKALAIASPSCPLSPPQMAGVLCMVSSTVSGVFPHVVTNALAIASNWGLLVHYLQHPSCP